MYRVLLADDEPWIIEGLKATIDWNAEGFEICASAGNGLEALSLLKSEAPDLALIDIRMPGMNGLEVIRSVRDDGASTQFIIISGYAEFDYAKKGIELNVSGYLLKPVEDEQLLFLVRSIRRQLDARVNERESDALLQDYENDTGYLLGRFPQGCAVVWQAGGDLDSLSGALLRLRVKPRCHLLVLPRGERPNPADLGAQIEGVGAVDYCEGSLSAAAVQAELAAYGFFTDGAHRVFTAARADEPREFDAIRAEALSGDPDRIRALFSDLRARLGQIGVSTLFRLWTLLDGAAPSGGIDGMVHRFDSAEDMLNRLEAALLQSPERAGGAPCPSPADYIRRHFCENISFADLCACFSVSATAMRAQINHETGMNFSQYLNSLRMKRAAQMLSDDGMTVNEIAAACGFEDSLYFRRVFKRYFRLSPSDYRARKLGRAGAEDE